MITCVANSGSFAHHYGFDDVRTEYKLDGAFPISQFEVLREERMWGKEPTCGMGGSERDISKYIF
jgi:hypothetical protein